VGEGQVNRSQPTPLSVAERAGITRARAEHTVGDDPEDENVMASDPITKPKENSVKPQPSPNESSPLPVVAERRPIIAQPFQGWVRFDPSIYPPERDPKTMTSEARFRVGLAQVKLRTSYRTDRRVNQKAAVETRRRSIAVILLRCSESAKETERR
jgi:hypothetical protein